MKKILLLLILPIIFCGCSVRKKLETGLISKTIKIEPFYSNDLAEVKKNVIVELDSESFKVDKLKKKSDIEKTKGIIIPLLLFNFWNNHYDCDLGKNSLIKNVDDIFEDIMKSEVKRSGDFFLNENEKLNNVNTHKFSIRIKPKSFNIEGLYRQNGHTLITPFFYSYSYADIAGPGVVKLRFKAELLEKGKVVHKTNVKITKNLEMLYFRVAGSQSELISDFNTGFGEAVSEALVEAAGTVVESVNEFISANISDAIIIENIDVKKIKKEVEETIAEESRINEFDELDTFQFILKDGREIFGVLKNVKKKVIILTKNRTAFVIKRKDLESIRDINNKDVTAEQLSRNNFKRVNYNYYRDVKYL